MGVRAWEASRPLNQQRDGIVITSGGAGFLVGGRATQLPVGRAALGFKTVAGHARARPGALVGSDLEEQRALQTTGLQRGGKLDRLLGPTAPSASSSAVFILERTMPRPEVRTSSGRRVAAGGDL